jgi:predicted ATP-grasp superfamily ATP-dependent carboligase
LKADDEMGNRFVHGPIFVEGLDASAYGIARSLGRHGLAVNALDSRKTDFFRFSRYCRACYTFQNDPNQPRTHAHDLIPNEHDLYELLVEWGRAFPAKPVLFATSDWFTRFLCNWQQELSSGFLFHWVSREVFTTITEKGRIAEFCKSVGVHVPLTWNTHPADDISSRAKEMPFPCLVKPIHRQAATFPIAAKVFIARNHHELESFLRANPQLMGATLAQELIEGGDDQIFQCTALVKHSGDMVHATVRKLHQFPPGYGTMCHGKTERNDELVSESLKFLEALGYRGLGSLEFKYRQSDNRYYFIEMNTRLPWYNGIFNDAGVNLPYLAYLDLVGQPDAVELRTTQQREIAWTSYRQYSAWYKETRKEHPISRWSWICSVGRVRSFAWWNWRDPMPFVASLFFRVRGLIAKGLKAAGFRR